MSLYNADELEAPEWMNAEFFESVLCKNEKCDSVEILNTIVEPASIKGDHYASIMLRCKLTYKLPGAVEPKTKSLVIKTVPDAEGMKRQMLMESKVFETEVKMYTETLPRIESILEEYGEPTRLKAELYHYSLQPHKVLVFEDLCESGYKVIRDRFLKPEEMDLVYKKIARLHAVSYLLGQGKDHEIVTQYRNGVFNSDIPLIKDLTTNGMNNFCKMLSCYEEFHSYVPKFKAIQDQVVPAIRNLFDAYTLPQGKGDIFVLNHGDFHLKNLMFKFGEKGELLDCIVVDYQLCCFAPSTIDMTYSQYIIMSPQQRLNRHELLHNYYKEFERVLGKLRCTAAIPAYKDFQQSFLKYRHYAIALLSAFLPMFDKIVSKSEEELKELDALEFVEGASEMEKSYHMKQYLEDIRNFLPILMKEGYFD